MEQLSKEAREAKNAFVREYQREYMRAWRKKNPEKIQAIQARYWEKKADESLKNQ